MNFPFVLCIIVTAVGLVQSDQFYRNEYYDYIVPKEVDCTSVRKAVIGTMMKSMCRPHYRLVSLKPMPLQVFQPSVVPVKRCDGHCPGLTCMPVKAELIKVPVKVTHRHSNGIVNNMCAVVEVEEHTQCRCRCQHKETDCNDRQYYVKSRCACVCKNQEFEKLECESKTGMLWDDKDCSCNCTQQDIQCESDLKWNRDKCECL